MIYNFNLGIGWASSGVEFAQKYRYQAFQRQGIQAKFIYMDMFQKENIQHMTAHMGFRDEDILWLYSFFTDFHIAPTTYTREDLEKTFTRTPREYTRNGKTGRYLFDDAGDFYTVFFTTEDSEYVHRVEYVSRNFLIRKDYFTYGRLFTEYYAPKDHKAHLYQRRFYNEDGSTAYEEIMDEGDCMYQFPDKILYSKEELVGYLVERLHLTAEDTVLIDRSTGIAQAILGNCRDARVGVIIHADHWNHTKTKEDYILWNNYYEYAFSMYRHIDFYVVATEMQRRTLLQQFREYVGAEPVVYTIPVGSIDALKHPTVEHPRRDYHILTASRLAPEKHVDWALKACVEVKKEIPELVFHIYGEGGAKKKLQELIGEYGAESYIKVMGQQDLTHVYETYDMYLSASSTEGFGLSLLEAIAAGDAMVGFDVPYGNPTFIQPGANGYLVPYEADAKEVDKVEGLAQAIYTYYQQKDRESFHESSYKLAEGFLQEQVSTLWKELLQ